MRLRERECRGAQMAHECLRDRGVPLHRVVRVSIGAHEVSFTSRPFQEDTNMPIPWFLAGASFASQDSVASEASGYKWESRVSCNSRNSEISLSCWLSKASHDSTESMASEVN